MSSNKDTKQIDEKVEIDLVAIPSEEANPVYRPFEQTVKIEWTPAELIIEKVQRMKRIAGFEKEIKGIASQIEVDQRHIDHLDRILNLPEVKALVDAEAEYLASTAKLVEETKPEEAKPKEEG